MVQSFGAQKFVFVTFHFIEQLSEGECANFCKSALQVD